MILDPPHGKGQLPILVLLAHDEELSDLTGLQHIAETLNPVDRNFLKRHERRCLGSDVDHRALGLQGEHGAVDDVAWLEVVVVLAQKSRKFIDGEASLIEVPDVGSAAGIIRAGDLFRNAEILLSEDLFGVVDVAAADLSRRVIS